MRFVGVFAREVVVRIMAEPPFDGDFRAVARLMAGREADRAEPVDPDRSVRASGFFRATDDLVVVFTVDFLRMGARTTLVRFDGGFFGARAL